MPACYDPDFGGRSGFTRLALENDVPGGTVLHIASGVETSVAELAELCRGAAGQHDHGGAVEVRGRDRAHPVGHARAGGERRDARLTRGLGPALGRERGRLLVTDVDDVDALVAAAVVDREQVAA